MKYETCSATNSQRITAALHRIIRCSVIPMEIRPGIWGYWGRRLASWRMLSAFAPSVSASRNKKKTRRVGNDQSGSQDVMRLVPQLMIGSALASSATRMMTSGTVSKLPLTMARERGEDADGGAPATSWAVAPTTRIGARKGTAASSLAERSPQRSPPMVITASPSSMASASTMKPGNGTVVVRAKPRLRTVAQPHSTSRGASTRRTAEYLAMISEPDAAATQIGQLMPASAEKRIVAPSADVMTAQIQAIRVERG